jgi:hypothetical protein
VIPTRRGVLGLARSVARLLTLPVAPRCARGFPCVRRGAENRCPHAPVKDTQGQGPGVTSIVQCPRADRFRSDAHSRGPATDRHGFAAVRPASDVCSSLVARARGTRRFLQARVRTRAVGSAHAAVRRLPSNPFHEHDHDRPNSAGPHRRSPTDAACSLARVPSGIAASCGWRRPVKGMASRVFIGQGLHRGAAPARRPWRLLAKGTYPDPIRSDISCRSCVTSRLESRNAECSL